MDTGNINLAKKNTLNTTMIKLMFWSLILLKSGFFDTVLSSNMTLKSNLENLDYYTEKLLQYSLFFKISLWNCSLLPLMLKIFQMKSPAPPNS